MKVLVFRPKQSSVTNYRQTRPLADIAVFRKTILRINDKVKLIDLAKRLKRISPIWNIKYIQDTYTANVIVTMRNAVNAKLVMDIDDNIWNVPVGNIARHGKGWDKQVAVNTGLVQCADWLTVSTKPLKDILSPVNDNIIVLKNLIDPNEWKHQRTKHDKIRIGWVWSPTHIPDIPVVEKALKKIHNKYKDRIEIVIFGRENNLFNFPTTNIKGVKFNEYPKLFREAGIDISICPLADNDFNKCKSNIKWLESTLAGACVVASRVYPYSKSIKNGKTGFLAKNNAQWIKHLSLLIEDKQKRKELQQNALKEVLANYTVQKNNNWVKFYKTL